MATDLVSQTAEASAHLLPTFARIPLTFERGEGSWLITPAGERYLDFAAGIAVNVLGHSHPHLVAALVEQAQKVWHYSNLYENPVGARLAARLCEATFADHVFFTNSGAEALEACIKMARKYHASNGQPERFRLITFEGAFHGRTLATIAAGGQAKYLDGFGPKVDGFDQVPFGDHEALRAAITPETAGILIEPVQGEGGVRPVPHMCLRGLRELCDELGLLLIFDEVQTGVGRSGRFFAHQYSGVTPDIMAIAKGIGGGFPLGACLSTTQAGKGLTPGTHGTTYGGNPLAMAVGNAVLDVVLEPEFLPQVEHKSIVLRQRLAELKDRYPDLIEDIRGTGLLIGIKMRVPNGEFVAAARAQHFLSVPAGDNVVRLLPPLNVTEGELGEAYDRLERACASLRRAKVGATEAAA